MPREFGGVRGWGGAGTVIEGGQAQKVENSEFSGPDDAAQPYDENLLLVAGYDRGNTETLAFKVPEPYIAWARLIVESRRFPSLRTKSDVGRLGFMRALAWLSGIAPTAAEKSVMHQLAQMSEKIAWERRNLEYVKFMDQFASVISELLALPQGRVQAGRILRRMRAHFNSMEEGFYKTHVEKMFTDRFAAYEQAGLVMVEAREGEDGEEEVDSGAEELAGMLREVEELLHAVEEE